MRFLMKLLKMAKTTHMVHVKYTIQAELILGMAIFMIKMDLECIKNTKFGSA